jgi:predicted RNase H-like HicB family nuclease
MATVEDLDERRGAEDTHVDPVTWHVFDTTTYECRVLLCPETNGGYSAHALRLPGVVSQGETIEEALRNIEDAFRGAIAVYREENQAIPWERIEIERTIGCEERWILVDV